jgi:hypothetical protein
MTTPEIILGHTYREKVTDFQGLAVDRIDKGDPSWDQVKVLRETGEGTPNEARWVYAKNLVLVEGAPTISIPTSGRESFIRNLIRGGWNPDITLPPNENVY